MALARQLRKHAGQLSQIGSKADLLALLDKLAGGRQSIAYQNRNLFVIWGLAVAMGLAVFSGAFSFFFGLYPGEGPYLGIAAIAGVVHFFVVAGRTNLGRLRQSIINRCIELDNGLNDQMSELDQSALIAHFKLFSRGNHKRYFERFCTKSLQDEGGRAYPFHFWHFHWVDKSTSTDSKGRRRTTYHHYDDYGVLLRLPDWAANIEILPKGLLSGKGDYTTASPDFNRDFKVKAQDPLAASRFLKPAVVEDWNQLEQDFPKSRAESCFLRFLPATEVCCWMAISLKKNLLAVDVDQGFSDVGEFRTWLSRIHVLPSVEKINYFLKDIVRQSTNQFEETSGSAMN